MKRNLIAMFVLMAGGLLAQTRDGYGQPGDYGNDRYDPRYDNNGYAESYDVRTAPPAPMFDRGFRRPAMPGPGFVWVDGYWSWMRGRYVWVGGFWTRPPFVGGYWVSPRYERGRFFAGFWGGNRNNNRYDRDYGRGPNRGGYGYRR
jgi:WXXGXW repeat (2 copies)